MNWFYRRLVRPALFLQDSESIHNRTLNWLSRASQSRSACRALSALYGAHELPVNLFGLRFPNPVGLAAGMDKFAAALPVWSALGFGFAELGGVTWHAQPGNPAPRMFRAVAERALINRMGFNNPGAEAMAGQLEGWKARRLWPGHPIGINLGKSKITPMEKAAGDYAASFRRLWAHGDFFVVNVSSPNTPNLRQLQDRAALDEILRALQEVNAELCKVNPRARARPILVKVAPDLTLEAIDEILELTGPRSVAGIVATNTTVTRPVTSKPALERVYAESGGLSGSPLRARSTEVVRHIYRQTRGALPVIGVGGVFTAEDAWEKITHGAALVQLYTALVFEGPGVVRQIVRGLEERLRSHGWTHLHQAVGTAVK
jgi:dihydroorotate dehydrogenase